MPVLRLLNGLLELLELLFQRVISIVGRYELLSNSAVLFLQLVMTSFQFCVLSFQVLVVALYPDHIGLQLSQCILELSAFFLRTN